MQRPGTRRALPILAGHPASRTLVLDVPAAALMNERPIFAGRDTVPRTAAPPHRPSHARSSSATTSRYPRTGAGFISPSRSTATVGDALDEAIRAVLNGRLWRYDIENGRHALSPDFSLHQLVLTSPGRVRAGYADVALRLTRFYLRGPKEGRAESGARRDLTGLDDGIHRDAEGRIWLALFSHRSGLLTWVHEHAWIKPLFMRLHRRPWRCRSRRRAGG